MRPAPVGPSRLLWFLAKIGTHILLADTVYLTTRRLSDGVLRRRRGDHVWLEQRPAVAGEVAGWRNAPWLEPGSQVELPVWAVLDIFS